MLISGKRNGIGELVRISVMPVRVDVMAKRLRLLGF
jgi:hypothetical protein